MRISTPNQRPNGNDHARIASALPAFRDVSIVLARPAPAFATMGRARHRRTIPLPPAHLAPTGRLDTRPTSDRLRETLFNVLAPRIARLRIPRPLRRLRSRRHRSPQPRRTNKPSSSKTPSPPSAPSAPICSSLGIRGSYALEPRSRIAAIKRPHRNRTQKSTSSSSTRRTPKPPNTTPP